jgi:phospholipid N-methyltransferase
MTQPSPRPSSHTPDWLLFLAKFLRHGTAIASLTPSSPWLARAICDGIDYTTARCLVELGAGTGPITAELLRRAPPSCRVVIVERDPDFCERLRQRFPAADIVEADACDLERLLDERGVAAVDHVLCGLPLPSFAREDRDRVIAAACRRLAPGGTFRQLTEIPWLYWRLYYRYFEDVRFRFVFRNLPPAGFYLCRRPRG